MAGDGARLDHRRVRGDPRRSSASGGASSSARCPSPGSRSVHSSAPAWVLCCCRRDRPRRTRPPSAWSARCSAGAILASGLEGLGFRLRRTLIAARARACSTALLGRGARRGARRSAIVWIVGGRRRADARRRRSCAPTSSARRSCASSTQLLPPSGPILNALARLDPLPSITGPVARRRAAAAAASRARPGVRAASRSVVRVLGTACGLAIEGSGWVAAPGRGRHQRARGRRRAATRPSRSGGQRAEPAGASRSPSTRRDDIAVLRVPGLGAARADARAPTRRRARAGAILGYPENGPFDARAGAHRAHADGAHRRTPTAAGPVPRLLTPLRGLVRPGNSGGPLVDGDGRVLTTVFAGTVGGGPRGGYGVANATVAARARPRRRGPGPR